MQEQGSTRRTLLYSPALKRCVGLPPAMPHGSITGALPGERHGLKRQKSWIEPGLVFRFVVRYCASSCAESGGFGSDGQWSKFGIRLPLPVHVLQPMVQPWLNQKALCPLLHGVVPFEHAPLYGMIQPVSGCRAFDHGVPGSPSTALRDGGMMMDAWPATSGSSASDARSRSIVFAVSLAILRSGALPFSWDASETGSAIGGITLHTYVPRSLTIDLYCSKRDRRKNNSPLGLERARRNATMTDAETGAETPLAAWEDDVEAPEAAPKMELSVNHLEGSAGSTHSLFFTETGGNR